MIFSNLKWKKLDQKWSFLKPYFCEETNLTHPILIFAIFDLIIRI
jgi:hypothetical protein